MTFLEQLTEEQRADLLSAAAKRGLTPARVEELARWILLGAHGQARLMEKMYAIIACSDSELVRRGHLTELAHLNFLPSDLVISDFNRWWNAGGRPAA